MGRQQRREILALLVVVVCGLVVLGLHYRSAPERGQPRREKQVFSFEEAQSRAFAAIRQREQWPSSPEALCEAFWKARGAKDYAEMEVLWPGSATFQWPETCRNEPNVVYVFAPAGPDGATVPYAAKDYFDAHGTYNLTMRLRVLATDKGPRYYIVSGN